MSINNFAVHGVLLIKLTVFVLHAPVAAGSGVTGRFSADSCHGHLNLSFFGSALDIVIVIVAFAVVHAERGP